MIIKNINNNIFKILQGVYKLKTTTVNFMQELTLVCKTFFSCPFSHTMICIPYLTSV